MNRIDRIKAMEEKYDRALKALSDLDAALDAYQKVLGDIEDLIAYYESAAWRHDFKADEEGKLPADLKRGVLSEDGLYDLLSDHQRLSSLLDGQ